METVVDEGSDTVKEQRLHGAAAAAHAAKLARLEAAPSPIFDELVTEFLLNRLSGES